MNDNEIRERDNMFFFLQDALQSIVTIFIDYMKGSDNPSHLAFKILRDHLERFVYEPESKIEDGILSLLLPKYSKYTDIYESRWKEAQLPPKKWRHITPDQYVSIRHSRPGRVTDINIKNKTIQVEIDTSGNYTYYCAEYYEIEYVL